MPDEKIEIENVIPPRRTKRVNRAKYEAMRDALLAVLPEDPPGLNRMVAEGGPARPRGEGHRPTRAVEAGTAVPGRLPKLRHDLHAPERREGSK